MEITTLDITAARSDAVLARIVVLLGARGGRIRELRCSSEPEGATRVWCVVETAPGRGNRLAATVARVVDVISVETSSVPKPAPASARLSALA